MCCMFTVTILKFDWGARGLSLYTFVLTIIKEVQSRRGWKSSGEKPLAHSSDWGPCFWLQGLLSEEQAGGGAAPSTQLPETRNRTKEQLGKAPDRFSFWRLLSEK